MDTSSYSPSRKQVRYYVVPGVKLRIQDLVLISPFKEQERLGGVIDEMP